MAMKTKLKLNSTRLVYDELPPLTVTWKEAQQPWEDFKAQHRDSHGALGGLTFRLNDIVGVDTSLEDRFFEERLVVTSDGILHVRFRNDYEIDLARIETPLHLVQWALHLSGKNWMKLEFLEAFMKAVCEIKDWRSLL